MTLDLTAADTDRLFSSLAAVRRAWKRALDANDFPIAKECARLAKEVRLEIRTRLATNG